MCGTRDIDYSRIPEHCQSGLRRYIENGCDVGGFLTAVLENNLVEAFGRADLENQVNMRQYADFLYNQAPSECWGSRSKVVAWMKKGGMKGGA